MLFLYVDRPGPMNSLAESDSEVHQLRRNGRQREQRQNCEREQQHVSSTVDIPDPAGPYSVPVRASGTASEPG